MQHKTMTPPSSPEELQVRGAVIADLDQFDAVLSAGLEDLTDRGSDERLIHPRPTLKANKPEDIYKVKRVHFADPPFDVVAVMHKTGSSGPWKKIKKSPCTASHCDGRFSIGKDAVNVTIEAIASGRRHDFNALSVTLGDDIVTDPKGVPEAVLPLLCIQRKIEWALPAGTSFKGYTFASYTLSETLPDLLTYPSSEMSG